MLYSLQQSEIAKFAATKMHEYVYIIILVYTVAQPFSKRQWQTDITERRQYIIYHRYRYLVKLLVSRSI